MIFTGGSSFTVSTTLTVRPLTGWYNGETARARRRMGCQYIEHPAEPGRGVPRGRRQIIRNLAEKSARFDESY